MADHAALPLVASTTDDLRANAANWTLAGDVGLLAHLQQFSDQFLHQIEETEGVLNNLVDRVEETSIKFHNISNQFLALQNSQFIENRVSEDDTPTDQVPSQPIVEPESQQRTLAIYKEAVSAGLKLLDTHYEQIDIPESSDSDDDSPGSSKPLLLRSKSAYSAPLPLLIGSAEWWADDSVGLGDYQENEDSETEITPSDEDEGEDVAPPPQFVRHSSSSSETNEVPVPIEAKRSYHAQSSYNVPLETGPPVDNLFIPERRENFGENFFGTEDMFGNYKTDARNNDLFGSSESLATRPIGQDLFSPAENLFDEPPTVPQRSVPPVASTRSTGKNVAKGSEEQAELFSERHDDGLFEAGLESKHDLVQPKSVISKVSNDFTKELAARLGNVAERQGKKMEEPTAAEEAAAVSKTTPSRPPTIARIARDEPPPVSTNRSVPKKTCGLFGDEDSDSDDTFKPSVKPRYLNPASSKPTAPAKPTPSEPASSSTILSKTMSIPTESRAPDLFADNGSGDDTFRPSTKPRIPSPAKSKPSQVGVPPVQPSKPPETQLFDDEDSDDDLFGAASKWSSASRTTSTGLFDKSTPDDLFGSSKAKAEPAPVPKSTETSSSMEKSKKESAVKKSSLFADDLFGDDDDIDLFSPNFLIKPHALTLPKPSDEKRMDLSSDKISASSPASRESRKSSLNSSAGADDLFGGISNLEASNNASNSRSLFDSHHEDNNPANLTHAADSRDLGFIESSNLSVSASNATVAPDSWFQPQFSSTQSAAHTYDSSGYKTGTLGTVADVSEAAGGQRQEEKRISTISEASPFHSHAEDSVAAEPESVAEDLFASRDRVKADDLFVAESIDRAGPSKPKPRQVLLEEDDFLFSTKPAVKIEPAIKTIDRKSEEIKESVHAGPLEDDLFGSSRPSRMKALFEEDDEDSSLFFDGKARTLDNISVSSGRSSIFDEITPGKSTLPAVFDKTSISAVKTSLFDSVDDDFDLFAPKAKAQGEGKPLKTAEDVAALRKHLPGIVEGDELFMKEPSDTPASVKVEDLDRDKAADKPDQLNTEPPPLSSQIFENDDDDDLFSKSSLHEENASEGPGVKTTIPPLPELDVEITKPENSSLEINTGAHIMMTSELPQSKILQKNSDKNVPDDGAEVKVEARPTPPNTLAVEKINEPQRPDELDGEVTRQAVKKKIGKLNIPVGLNINTAALLPGAKLKRPESTSQKEDIPPESADADETKTSSAVKAKESSGDLLHSALRDRARIQVKRRPQSRRARQEALRTSGIDFGVAEDSPESAAVSPGHSMESSGTQFWSVENTPSPAFASPSNPLSPSTDSEDYFNVPSLDSNEKDDGNLFDSVRNAGAGVKTVNVLFDKPPLISPAAGPPSETRQSKPTKSISSNSLFADDIKEEHSILTSAAIAKENKPSLFDDEDDNLFSDSVVSQPLADRQLPPVKELRTEDPKPPAEVKKAAPSKVSASIFDEDDSLFGVGPVFSQPQPVKEVRSVDPKPPAQVKKAAPSKVSASIFDEDDNDDDLFKAAAASQKTAKKSSTVPANPQPAEQKIVNSLFADSDDDEIFMKTTKSSLLSGGKADSKPAASKPLHPAAKASGLDENFVDPLGLLRND